jgi:hypothetical protein
VDMSMFMALAITMTAGYAMGFLLTGIGSIRSGRRSERTA